MSPIEQYLSELKCHLRVRGRARRRLLQECRDHLEDASVVRGEDEAVSRFGAAAELAASFDAEVATRLGTRATVASLAGVLAVGASTLALLQVAEAHATAVPVWAVIFFASAQVAMVSTALAALQAVACRHRPGTSGELALLCRRNTCALAFAALTLVAAAGAVPGRGSVTMLLPGPLTAIVAGVLVLRVRSLARRIDTGTERTVRSPVADLAVVANLPPYRVSSVRLLALTLVGATAGAFMWDRGDGGTVTSSITASAIEAALVLLGFLVLGPALGLRPARRPSRGAAAL